MTSNDDVARFRTEVTELLYTALKADDLVRAAAVLLFAETAIPGVIEVTDAVSALGQHLAGMSEQQMQRVTDIVAELQARLAVPARSAALDPDPELSVQDVSHGLLVALLMHLGGSYVLPLDAIATDAMDHVDGTLYAVQSQPVDGDHVRLVVVADPGHSRPQPAAPGA